MATAHSPVQLTDAQRARVLAHLQELLDSPPFAGSKRRQAFLRYVVEQTLAGRGASIKETNIAVDVFERAADFDAQSVSVVRVTGGEVRKRLAQAYASGLTSDVRIELPLGSYHPLFEFQETAAPVTAEAPAMQFEPVVVRLSGMRRYRLWIVAATVLLAAAAVWAALRPAPPIEQLWAPFFKPDAPALIYMAAPTLLHVPEAGKWLPLRPGESIPTSALQQMDSTYVGTGAALGAAMFAQHLTAHDQPFHLKFGSDLSFADLKNSPSILLGASRWTSEFHSDLRFQLIRENGALKIVDYKKPEQSWAIPIANRDDRAEGFVLVTRLVQSESGQPAMLVVGMDSRNTMAGVEFLSQPATFSVFADKAPAGWENKNFQVVLRNSIHGNSAGSLDVMAMHVW